MMIAGYAIQELLTLLNERYPDWSGFADERFVQDETEPIRRLAKRGREELSKAAFRDLLRDGDYDELWQRLERLGRSSTLLWTGNRARGDLAILYEVRDRQLTWPFLEQLRALLYDRSPSPDRLQQFAEFCDTHQLANRWPFPTYFMFLVRPHAEILVKPRLTRWFLQFMGMGGLYSPTPTAETYERFKKTCHGLLAELKEHGAKDLIDIYGLLNAAHRVSEARVEGLKLEAQIDLDRPLAVGEERPLYQLSADPSNEGDMRNDNRSLADTHPPLSLAELAQAIGWEEETVAQWVNAVRRKKQAIFYGPPGTGKTYVAGWLARFLVGGGDGIIETIQFHPAYDYTDFIEGIRPQTTADGRLTYVNQPGRFLQFCQQAAARTGPSVLIIDEINRANLAQVFGELMYLLEYREAEIALASGRPFALPEQVILLGTMNTADRSIALIDHALRRRFAFVHLPPNDNLLRQRLAAEPGVQGHNLVEQLQAINAVIGDPHFYLGISYFLVEGLADKLPGIWQMEIEPYLEELFAHQPEMLNRFRWDKIAPRVIESS